MRKLPFLILWLSLAGLPPASPAEGQSPTPATPPLAASTPAPATPPVPAAAPPATDAAAVLAEARRIEEHAASQVSLIVTLMEVFIGLVTLVTIILTGIGLREWKHVSDKAEDALQDAREAGRQAKEAADQALRETLAIQGRREELAEILESSLRANELKLAEATQCARQTAEAAEEQIDAMRQRMKMAWGNLGPAFDKLPRMEAEWVVGGQNPEIDPDLRAQFEDFDLLLVVSDRFGIEDEPARNSKYHLRFAQYWRLVRNFPRALQRNERALELSSDQAIPRLSKAITLSHWAAYERENPNPRRVERLDSALALLEEARRLQVRDTAEILYHFAWTLDEMDRVDEAIDYARKAGEALRAEHGQRPPKEFWEYDYNFAAYLARAKRFDEVMPELTRLVGMGTKWVDSALEDSYFEEFRESLQWKEPFERLLEEGRRAG